MMKVALQFDEPWEFTEHLAGKWWPGSLDDNGWVEMDKPFQFRGHEHRRVHLQPRHPQSELAKLGESEQRIVNAMVESPDGDFCLIGSIRRV